MKYYCFFAFFMLQAATVSAQTPRRHYAQQKDKGVPQRMPVKRLKKDSPASAMPVVKPDTAVQKKMPVVKPPANIQPK